MSTRSRARKAEETKVRQLPLSAVKELTESIAELQNLQQMLAVAKAHQDSLLRAFGLDPTKPHRVEPDGRVTEVDPNELRVVQPAEPAPVEEEEQDGSQPEDD
jgi:hypothetical protein